MKSRILSLVSLVVMFCAVICSGIAQAQTERAGASPPSQPLTILSRLPLVQDPVVQDADLPEVKAKQRLPNGEYVVVIDGKEQRTITEAHALQIAERNATLDRCQRARAKIDEAISKYDQQVALLTKDAQLADLERDKQQERAGRLEAMYNAESALRLKAEELNNAHSKKPWLLKLIDSPYAQVGFKAVIPTVNMLRALRN